MTKKLHPCRVDIHEYKDGGALVIAYVKVNDHTRSAVYEQAFSNLKMALFKAAELFLAEFPAPEPTPDEIDF